MNTTCPTSRRRSTWLWWSAVAAIAAGGVLVWYAVYIGPVGGSADPGQQFAAVNPESALSGEGSDTLQPLDAAVFDLLPHVILPAPSGDSTLDQIRYDLSGWCGNGLAFARVRFVEMGDRVLPYFERILADPTSTHSEIEKIFIYLRLDLGHLDRRRFVEPAVEYLAHPELDVRQYAVMLLREIGSGRDTPPVVAMLYDESKYARMSAAISLRKLGGKADLAALNVWLTNSRQEDPQVTEFVREYRDELEAWVADAWSAKPALDPETLDRVRFHLSGVETKSARQELREMGDKVLPFFERVVAEPRSPRELERVYTSLRVDFENRDRSRFVEPAVKHLAHPEVGVRHSALLLLEEIGGGRDTPPVVALLYDSEKVLRHAAADCLSKIGSKRDVAALNIWLAASQKEELKTIRHVRECRNELEKRLAKEENKSDKK